MKYIKSVDGIAGCFRGLVPRICYANVYYLVYNKVSELCPIDRGQDLKAGGDKGAAKTRVQSYRSSTGFTKSVMDLVPPDFQAFVKTLSWDVVSVTVGTTVSYPFHLLAVRSMAQFVGRETKYE